MKKIKIIEIILMTSIEYISYFSQFESDIITFSFLFMSITTNRQLNPRRKNEIKWSKNYPVNVPKFS
jgi:hypothetical protein